MNEQPSEESSSGDETDQEEYRELLKVIRERDGKISALETEVKTIKEEMKKQHEETEKTIVGWCRECRHPVTAADVKLDACPHCGASKAYRPINPPDE